MESGNQSFSNSSISIRGNAGTGGPGLVPPRQTAGQILTQFIQSRYDSSIALLDLENMDQDPLLRAAGQIAITQGLNDSSSKIGPVLCQIIGENCPEVNQ